MLHWGDAQVHCTTYRMNGNMVLVVEKQLKNSMLQRERYEVCEVQLLKTKTFLGPSE